MLISTLTSVSLTLSTLTIICPQELAKSHRDVTQLTTELEQLCKEKTDLLEEVEAYKSRVRPSYVISNQLTLEVTVKSLCGAHW